MSPLTESRALEPAEGVSRLRTLDDAMLASSLRVLLAQIGRHKWLVAFIIVLAYGATAAMLARAQRSYEVSTSLLPPLSTGDNAPAGLAALAKNFGLGGGGGPADNSSMYESVLKSRLLLGKMMERRFTFNGKPDQGLFQIYGLDVAKDSAKASAELLSKIRKGIKVEKDPDTRLVTISFPSSDPAFAAEFLNQLVAELVEYFRALYAEMNREKYEYSKTGLDSAAAALAASSSKLTRFREQNRNISPFESPHIAHRLMELEREMRIDEERFLLFKKETELVKLQMKEGQFNIEVLDAATPAVIGKTGRLKTLVAGLFLGPFFAMLAVQLAEWLLLLFRRRPSHPRE